MYKQIICITRIQYLEICDDSDKKGNTMHHLVSHFWRTLAIDYLYVSVCCSYTSIVDTNRCLSYVVGTPIWPIIVHMLNAMTWIMYKLFGLCLSLSLGEPCFYVCSYVIGWEHRCSYLYCHAVCDKKCKWESDQSTSINKRLIFEIQRQLCAI